MQKFKYEIKPIFCRYKIRPTHVIFFAFLTKIATIKSKANFLSPEPNRQGLFCMRLLQISSGGTCLAYKFISYINGHIRYTTMEKVTLIELHGFYILRSLNRLQKFSFLQLKDCWFPVLYRLFSTSACQKDNISPWIKLIYRQKNRETLTVCSESIRGNTGRGAVIWYWAY